MRCIGECFSFPSSLAKETEISFYLLANIQSHDEAIFIQSCSYADSIYTSAIESRLVLQSLYAQGGGPGGPGGRGRFTQDVFGTRCVTRKTRSEPSIYLILTMYSDDDFVKIGKKYDQSVIMAN